MNGRQPSITLGNKENESVSIALNPNIPIKMDQQNTFNCGYLFLQSIYF